MSTTLDPCGLRLLLQRLHNEFPGVDYATLVRSVMEVECTSTPKESMESYYRRVSDSIREQAESGCDTVLRTAKIILHRHHEEVA